MTVEYTLSIIKPDATARNITGKINSYLEAGNLKIVAQKMMILPVELAEEFYIEHKSKSFFNSLVNFMCSGPVVLQVLKGENAIALNRSIMGATDPKDAHSGTIRADFAESIEANCIHGSDSALSADKEIKLFFKSNELME